MKKIFNNFSLRQRTTISFVIICFILFSLVYLYSSNEISKGFLKLEEDDANTNISRILDSMKSDENNYTNTLVGYAQWDDSFNYITQKSDAAFKEKADAFEVSNLGPTLATLKIDLFSYWALDKKLSFGCFFDLITEDDSKKIIPFKPEISSELIKTEPLFQTKKIDEYTVIYQKFSDSPFMLISIPSSTSDAKTPANGLLIGGIKINAEYFSKLGDKLHLKITSIDVQTTKIDEINIETINKINNNNNTLIERPSNEKISVYTIIKDLNKKDLVLIKVDIPRSIFIQSQNTLETFLITMIISAILLVLIILLFIDKLVLAKIFQLSNVINNIIKTGNLEKKVPDLGGDEIGELGESFNTMVVELEKLKASAVHNEKMVSLGEMSGGIAHEINNPIGIINVSANLMKLMYSKGITDPEKYLKQLDVITDTVTRISLIVTGLKNISRDTGQEDFGQYSLHDILTDSIAICSEKFKLSGVKVKVNFDDPIFQSQLSCLRVQMSQVFFNLLSNSFDAIEKSIDPWVEISASVTPEGTMIILLKDSGNGIPKEIQSKIFQPFYTTKEIGKGTGLGLSLCNSIILRNGGTLTIDNDCKNTCFVIKLPKKM